MMHTLMGIFWEFLKEEVFVCGKEGGGGRVWGNRIHFFLELVIILNYLLLVGLTVDEI